MPASYMSAATSAAVQAVWEPLAPYVGFHTASPGTTGANESGIARSALTWAGHTATVSLVVPIGTTVTHLGYWSAASAGTYSDGAPLPGVYVGPITIALTLGPDTVTSNN